MRAQGRRRGIGYRSRRRNDLLKLSSVPVCSLVVSGYEGKARTRLRSNANVCLCELALSGREHPCVVEGTMPLLVALGITRRRSRYPSTYIYRATARGGGGGYRIWAKLCAPTLRAGGEV